MKKIILCFVCVFCVALNASAQKLFEIDRIVQQKNCTVVIAGDMELPVNAELHAAVLKNPSSYLMMDYEGTGGFIRTLIQKDKISISILEVDTTAYYQDYDMAFLQFKGGSGFLTYDLRWLKVKKGQHVKRSMLDGETKCLVIVSTVERDEPLVDNGNKPYPWEWRDSSNKLLSAIVLPGGQIPPLNKAVATKAVKTKQTKKEIALAQVTVPATQTNTQTSRPALIRN